MGLYGAPSRDILPAVEHRSYSQFSLRGEERFLSGVLFRDSTGNEIVNYPKQHLANGNAMNKRTGGCFKQVIRVAKNARDDAVRRELLEKDEAPSHFIECILYNVPDEHFQSDLPAAYRTCVEWLASCLDAGGEAESFWCQNGIVNLFGNGPDSWDVKHARTFVAALREA